MSASLAPRRNLRILERHSGRVVRRGVGSGSFWGVVFLLLLHFFLQGNVLRTMGIVVNMRVQPANVLLAALAVYVLFRGRYSLHERLRRAPGLMLFVFTVPLFSLYTICFNGISGAAFYWDSFWAPGLIVLCLEDATDRQRRWLAKFLLVIVLGNVVFGLYESLIQNNFFPFVATEEIASKREAAIQATQDFRANAFYPHPLTASLLTAMMLLLLYQMQLRFIILAPSFVLLLVGLLAFGGRTALAVAILMTGIAAVWVTVSGILNRNLKLGTAVYMILGAIGVPILVAIIVTQTHIAERIIDTMYYDDSAEVRVIQWRVLNYLSLQNWLFGVPMDDLIHLKYQIGLNDVEDIENFWLLLFLNLGAIGYVVFLGVFFTFLYHIAQTGGGLFSWLLMLAGLIIDSSSNSLGQKTYDLLMEAVMLMAMSGYVGWSPSRMRFARLPRVTGPRFSGMRGLAPSLRHDPRLRSLRS